MTVVLRSVYDFKFYVYLYVALGDEEEHKVLFVTAFLNNDLVFQKILGKSYRKRFYPSMQELIQNTSRQSFKLQF